MAYNPDVQTYVAPLNRYFYVTFYGHTSEGPSCRLSELPLLTTFFMSQYVSPPGVNVDKLASTPVAPNPHNRLPFRS